MANAVTDICTAVDRILKTVFASNAVVRGYRDAENFAKLPAVCYSVDAVTDDRGNMTTNASMESATVAIHVFVDRSHGSRSDDALFNAVEDVVDAFEDDNIAGTTALAAQGFSHWANAERNLYPDDAGISVARITLTAVYRRRYGGTL